MPERMASVLVADEIYYNLQGKVILQGVYINDIVIASDPSALAQLIFFFTAETDLTDPFRSLQVQVTLPGNAPISTHVPLPPPAYNALSTRTRFAAKWPLLVPTPLLRAGQIVAKVIHERGELVATTPWIVTVQVPNVTS
jgi:hypothetical protein